MKQIDLIHYNDLLHKLYLGPTEDDPFSSFLLSVREFLDLNLSSITLRQPEGDNGGLLFISSDFLAKTFVDSHDNDYTDRYYAADPLSNLNFGEVVTLDEVISGESLKKSDFYKLCMERVQLRYMIGVDLQNYNGKRFSVRFCRPKTGKPFSQDDKDFVKLLTPHLQRAVALGSQLSEIASERQLYASTISGYSIGTITLNEAGRVLKVNQMAQTIIDLSDGIRLVADKLCISSREVDQYFSDRINQALTQQRNQALNIAHALSIPRESGSPDFEVVIKSLPLNRNIEPKNSPHLILFITNPEKRISISVKALMNLYDLTLSEACLTALLAEGKDLDEIAGELKIARNTVRAHLRAIFAKTGVTRQPMLVSLVLKSLASLPVYDHLKPPEPLARP